MEGLGYAYSMLPFIKDTYKDDPEGMKQSVLAHLQFLTLRRIQRLTLLV